MPHGAHTRQTTAVVSIVSDETAFVESTFGFILHQRKAYGDFGTLSKAEIRRRAESLRTIQMHSNTKVLSSDNAYVIIVSGLAHP